MIWRQGTTIISTIIIIIEQERTSIERTREFLVTRKIEWQQDVLRFGIVYSKLFLVSDSLEHLFTMPNSMWYCFSTDVFGLITSKHGIKTGHYNYHYHHYNHWTRKNKRIPSDKKNRVAIARSLFWNCLFWTFHRIVWTFIHYVH